MSDIFFHSISLPSGAKLNNKGVVVVKKIVSFETTLVQQLNKEKRAEVLEKLDYAENEKRKKNSTYAHVFF